MAKKNVKKGDIKLVETSKSIDNVKKNNNDDLNEKVKSLTLDLDDDLFKIERKVNTKDTINKNILDDKDKGGNDWLAEQLELLRIENENFEAEIVRLKKENDKLKNEFVGMYNSEGEQIIQMKKKIIELYKELKSRYTGDNSQNVRWTDVKILYLIEKLEKDFSFV